MSNEIKKPMTREEMVSAIAMTTGLDKKTIKEVIAEYEKMLILDLTESHETKIGIIGKIKITERKERKGLNPLTKERVIIPSKMVPKFVFSKGLKDYVDEKIKK